MAHYEVFAQLDADGRPTGVFRMARRCRTWFGLPQILCDHLHPDIESARACQYFAGLDQDEKLSPLFHDVY